MSAEQEGVADAALQMGFTARVNEAVTDWQLAKVNRNAREIGLIEYLGEQAGTMPWTAYTDIMDGVVAATPLEDWTATDYEATAAPKTLPGRTTLGISFLGEEERDRFHGLCEYAWAGIRPATMPRIRPTSPYELRVSNLGYPDIATLGRLGSVFLDKQYPGLGRNRRLVIANRISEIESSGVTEFLPEALHARIAHQKARWGELASTMLFSSGNLGIIGRALREALGNMKLEVQRPRHELPYIEEGAHFFPFYPAGSDIPISYITVGQKLMGQVVYEPLEEIKAPFRQGRVVKGLVDLANMAWELGLKEGAVSGVLAVSTVIRAIGSALIGKIEDDRTKRQRGLSVILV